MCDKGPLPCDECGTVTNINRLMFGVDCDCDDSATCVHGLCSQCLYDAIYEDLRDEEDDDDDANELAG